MTQDRSALPLSGRIAHIGAFSMPNWGDGLYPPVLKTLLRELGVHSDISHYAPVPGMTTDGDRIGTLAEIRASSADIAFVGGGDLIRFDKRTVALDHLSVATEDRGSRLQRLRALRFARRTFLPGPGPWVPESGWLAQGPSVLLSVGVHTIPDTAETRKAFSHCAGAWVRTRSGADRLIGAGVPAQKVVVAPDMIFALPELEEPQRVGDSGRAVVSRRTGIDDAPVVVHAAGFHGWPVDRVTALLKQLSRFPVVTLSLGSYAGEDRLLRVAADRAGVPSLIDLRTTEITSVLAGAGAVFTTSMHAAIVGASFGTPVITPGVGKTKDAFGVLPDPPALHSADESSVASVVQELLGTRLPHSTAGNREAVRDALVKTLQVADLM